MKKRNVKIVLYLLMTFIIMMSFSTSAYAADSAVTFENGRLIAFKPGSIYTDSDLFDDFKGLMPGDTRAEAVTIQNKSDDYDYIKVYMKAVLHDEDGNLVSDDVLSKLQSDKRRGEASELQYMYDFLSKLSMKVNDGNKQIYESSPNKLDGLADNVYLGSIRKGETLNLNVELNAPIEMSNKYMNRIGEVDWEFVVEGFDDAAPAGPANLIQTGQLNWPILVCSGLGILFILCGLFIAMKRRKSEHV